MTPGPVTARLMQCAAMDDGGGFGPFPTTPDPQAVTTEQVGRYARRLRLLDDLTDEQVADVLAEYLPEKYEAAVRRLARDKTFDR